MWWWWTGPYRGMMYVFFGGSPWYISLECSAAGHSSKQPRSRVEALSIGTKWSWHGRGAPRATLDPKWLRNLKREVVGWREGGVGGVGGRFFLAGGYAYDGYRGTARLRGPSRIRAKSGSQGGLPRHSPRKRPVKELFSVSPVTCSPRPVTRTLPMPPPPLSHPCPVLRAPHV